ncbi:hypothetical protein ACS0TY_034344 [Phlomoides rotata]
MAFLFVDLTKNNHRFVQISVRILELLLLSTGLFSTLLMVKGALPPFPCEIVFSSLIEFWTSVTCLLSSPLSICIIINVTVVLIVASSTFFSRENGRLDDEISIIVGEHLGVQLADSLSSPPPAPPPSPRNIYVVPESTELADSLSSPPPAPPPSPRNIYVVPEPTELAHTEDDTMEATWRAITGEGKQRAKKKHLKKSETWDVHVHAQPRASLGVQRLDSEALLPTTPKWKELRKAETFNDAVSVTRRGGLIRRDPSMSIEEFNQQVEAFIKKFNDNMRLQRQESNQRFFESMNTGI